MKVNIRLGRPNSETSPMLSSPGGDTVHYPTFHYSGPEDLDLPTDGEMTIDFRKVSETSRVNPDGSHWYECTIEVREINEVDADEDDDVEPPTRRDTSAEDNLDRLMKEHMDEEGDEDDKERY
jgi:hypothetical protein